MSQIRMPSDFEKRTYTGDDLVAVEAAIVLCFKLTENNLTTVFNTLIDMRTFLERKFDPDREVPNKLLTMLLRAREMRRTLMRVARSKFDYKKWFSASALAGAVVKDPGLMKEVLEIFGSSAPEAVQEYRSKILHGLGDQDTVDGMVLDHRTDYRRAQNEYVLRLVAGPGFR